MSVINTPERLKTLLWKTKISKHVNGCWQWLGSKYKSGYGEIWCYGKKTLTHRVSFELANGPIPDGLLVLHHCDNPICVNPEHLFLGTHADNMADKKAKGRSTFGEKSGMAKLTNQKVLLIRNDTRFQYEIAKAFDINQTTVSLIKRRVTWTNI